MVLALSLIVIGIVFFARALGLIEQNAFDIIWPLILIVGGLSLVTHKWFGHHCSDKECWRCHSIVLGKSSKKK